MDFVLQFKNTDIELNLTTSTESPLELQTKSNLRSQALQEPIIYQKVGVNQDRLKSCRAIYELKKEVICKDRKATYKIHIRGETKPHEYGKMFEQSIIKPITLLHSLSKRSLEDLI